MSEAATVQSKVRYIPRSPAAQLPIGLQKERGMLMRLLKVWRRLLSQGMALRLLITIDFSNCGMKLILLRVVCRNDATLIKNGFR